MNLYLFLLRQGVGLAQLGQNPSGGLRVEKGDEGAVGAATRRLVDQFNPCGTQIRKSSFEIGHLIGNMVRSFTVFLQESGHR